MGEFPLMKDAKLKRCEEGTGLNAGKAVVQRIEE